MSNTLDMEVAVLLNGKTATILDDTARAELWPKLVAEAPQVGEFQTRITRQVPVFMLTRQDCPVTRAAGLPRWAVRADRLSGCTRWVIGSSGQAKLS